MNQAVLALPCSFVKNEDAFGKYAINELALFRYAGRRHLKSDMPNITPHTCRHTYCSNQAKAGMNPKTLQYLMGHSDIGVTMNVYTHLGLEDAAAEMARMEAVEAARKEQEKISGEDTGSRSLSQKMFRAV